jgi:hypothetical protein
MHVPQSLPVALARQFTNASAKISPPRSALQLDSHKDLTEAQLCYGSINRGRTMAVNNVVDLLAESLAGAHAKLQDMYNMRYA